MIGFGFFKKALFILSLLILSLYFLLTSRSGLYVGLWLLNRNISGTVEIHNLQGRLLDNISAKNIVYKKDNMTIVIDQLSLQYRLNVLGYDLSQGSKVNAPRIKGILKAEQIHIGNIALQNFTGNFSANNQKDAVGQGTFQAKYQSLAFEGKVHYKKQQLQLELRSGNNQIKLQGTFPYPWQAEADFKEPALVHSDLQGLNARISAIANLRAEKQGQVKILVDKGFLNTKAIQGLHFLGAELQANLRPQGIDSRGFINIDKDKKFTFNLHFPKFQHWQGSGNLYALDKNLLLKGQGRIAPKFEGKIDVQGNDFPLIESKEYKIWISPKLQALFDAQSLTISGTVLVPKAEIIPITFEDTVVLSDDVSFVGPEAPKLPFNVNVDVSLNTGEQVLLDIAGLHTLLTGSIHVHKSLQGPLNATGQLNVKNGKYKAYGQDLDISQGQLLFTGGLITNPGIQLKASKIVENAASSNSRFSNKITVGVEVSGGLNAPKVELFANPAGLSQADILSMLILGHPIKEASKAGGQLLMAAISSMNLGASSKGSQLLEQVKNSLGIDVNVKTNTSFDQKTNSLKDSTAVEIGKSLSDRIYVSYNRGLTMQTDANVLTLKYMLTQFFSIQVTASDAGNGIDLLYSSKKDEKNAK